MVHETERRKINFFFEIREVEGSSSLRRASLQNNKTSETASDWDSQRVGTQEFW